MTINLVPLNFSNTSLLDEIIVSLRKYRYEGKLLNLVVDIESSFDVNRKQYFSNKILSDAISAAADVEGKVLILTDKDLFVPVLTFVFGEAQLKGNFSIVSVCRLHEEFYSGVSNYKILVERTLKEVYHELGHNFGLKHCRDWDCVMHSSSSIEEVDIKGNIYCKACSESVK
jgi:archaemetzincin